MGDRQESAFRAPKTKPHEEDEDFDFRRTIVDDEDLSDIFVVYEGEDIEKEVKDKIEELGFSFTGEHWENKNPMSKEKIADLELDGIIVEKI